VIRVIGVPFMDSGVVRVPLVDPRPVTPRSEPRRSASREGGEGYGRVPSVCAVTKSYNPESVPSIISCPNCAAVVVPQEAGGFCPQCRTPLPQSDVDTVLAHDAEDVTRLAAGSVPRAATSPLDPRRPSSSSSGRLTSSGAIDHGRFEPGTVLGGRYRIVERLGRGGMGEVYRADDLKLGQPVALKLLSSDVDRDPARLTQLHTEVRMARQVSHPNVCRVYDIDEIDGHTFLSMEYVDGEDLATLLRRIGRFPEDRALEIARQICAGLTAAHERDVVHRDLKPANVMLDGTGKIRITDFGLAGASGEAVRAGTPAYMAPEQLTGNEVTPRSDIYSLGLVLYEVFTGQRALEGQNLAELIHKREQSGILPPTALVKSLDPKIESAIMRCLKPEPEARPASALAVAAILPGGDPLAAALAAGETPSPEMVAAAGSREVISLRTAVLAAAWIGFSLLTIALLYQRVMLINRVPTPKPPDALLDRAVDALARLGYGEDVRDSARGLGFSLDYVRYIAATSSAATRWDLLSAQRPEAFVLWRRTSPRTLVPFSDRAGVFPHDPPMNVGGMTLTIVDASGRLAEFVAVPEPADPAGEPRAADWRTLFDAAGLPIETFAVSEPRVVPPVFADQRVAWEGHLPEIPEHSFRVEAASLAGRPVYFVVSGEWSRSSRAPLPARPLFNLIISNLAALIMPALMIAAAVLARHNVRLGRGDRRGALRAATFLMVTTLVSWVLSDVHVGMIGIDVQRVFNAIATALFGAGLLWLTYLGVEPYIRRYSPDSLLGWTRLIGGRWRDARVATDVLLGVSVGLGMTLLYALHHLLPPLFGRPEPTPFGMDASILLGTRHVLSHIIERIGDAVMSGMLGVVGIVALALLCRRQWIAAVAGMIAYLPVVVSGMFPDGTPRLDLAIGLAISAVFVSAILRFGLLATIAALATHFILLRAPITTELASWRGSLGLWFVGVIAAAGFGACYIARNGGAEGALRTS